MAARMGLIIAEYCHEHGRNGFSLLGAFIASSFFSYLEYLLVVFIYIWTPVDTLSSTEGHLNWQI